MLLNALYISSGSILKVGEVLKNNNIEGKVLYVSDTIVDRLYGSIVKRQLSENGLVVKEVIINDNTITFAMELAERIIATDINCIIGLGGGRVLDVCKYAAYITKTNYLSIPTTAANDGLVSPIAVLKRNDGRPKSLGAAMPSMVVIDTDVIAKGPLSNIKAGIGDIISNYTALLDWELAASKKKDTINGYAYIMSKDALEMLLNSQYKEICPSFIEILVHSLVLSGVSMHFAGSSRPVSGSEHCFSHALDYYGKKQNLHGIQVALGTIIMLKATNRPYAHLLRYLKSYEIDINPITLGIDEETFIKCMTNASSMRKGRYTCLDEIDLNDSFLKKLYKELTEEL